MIRPTSSANVAKGNMPRRQDHFPHGSAAIMRPTHFTGKMFPSNCDCSHSTIYYGKPISRIQTSNKTALHRASCISRTDRALRTVSSPTNPVRATPICPFAAPYSNPRRALVRSITLLPSSNANTPRIHSTHPEQRAQYIIHQLRTPCRTAFKSTPYGALVRSITPVPSSNANTPRIHSTHSEQRIQRAIRLFLTHLLR